MKKAKILVDREFTLAHTAPEMYSSFLEHLARDIYGGIFDENSPLSDEEGFRKDVMAYVQDLHIALARYPGGNFVSGYHWEDGVGPLAQRPRVADVAYFVTETNRFGTNEFMRWANKAGVAPLMSINLGTRGVEDAKNLIEYCNLPGGSRYSDLRIAHGVKDPYNIKFWCLGNEMDGPWQIGHKTGYEYGRLACETAKVMKWVDPSVKLVICGSSGRSMDTYPDYSRVALEECYEHVDYLALHQYYQREQNESDDSFLTNSADLDRYLDATIALIDFVKEKVRGKKQIKICFDEYNVWHFDPDQPYERWTDKPIHLGESHYNMIDALLFSSMLLSFLRHADRVGITCLALLVNDTGAIMTTPEGAYRQSIYFPFQHCIRWGQGVVLNTPVQCERYDGKHYDGVKRVDSVTVWNEEKEQLTVFAVNKDAQESLLEITLNGFGDYAPVEHITMDNEDLTVMNRLDKQPIAPRNGSRVLLDGNTAQVTVTPYSWNVVRFEKRKRG